MENYLVLIKKYVGMIIFSFVLLFSGIALANIAEGNWVDGVFLLLIAIAVSIIIYAAYMMIIHYGIVNSDKRI